MLLFLRKMSIHNVEWIFLTWSDVSAPFAVKSKRSRSGATSDPSTQYYYYSSLTTISIPSVQHLQSLSSVHDWEYVYPCDSSLSTNDDPSIYNVWPYSHSIHNDTSSNFWTTASPILSVPSWHPTITTYPPRICTLVTLKCES